MRGSTTVTPLLEAISQQGLVDSVVWASSTPPNDPSVAQALADCCGTDWNGKFLINAEFNVLDSGEPDNNTMLEIHEAAGASVDDALRSQALAPPLEGVRLVLPAFGLGVVDQYRPGCGAGDVSSRCPAPVGLDFPLELNLLVERGESKGVDEHGTEEKDDKPAPTVEAEVPRFERASVARHGSR